MLILYTAPKGGLLLSSIPHMLQGRQQSSLNPKPEEGKSESSVMNTNAIAPFLVITPLLKNLQGQKKLALVSSQLGSREAFGKGSIPKPIYHASKCVLNDGFREQEPAWRERYGLTSVIFHPGWVSGLKSVDPSMYNSDFPPSVCAVPTQSSVHWRPLRSPSVLRRSFLLVLRIARDACTRAVHDKCLCCCQRYCVAHWFQGAA